MENAEVIIKKYETTLLNIAGRSVDTMVLSKIAGFSEYAKKTLAVIAVLFSNY